MRTIKIGNFLGANIVSAISVKFNLNYNKPIKYLRNEENSLYCLLIKVWTVIGCDSRVMKKTNPSEKSEST